MTKAPAVDLLRLNTLRGTRATFVTPERYDKYHCPFYMGAPLSPGLNFGRESSLTNE